MSKTVGDMTEAEIINQLSDTLVTEGEFKEMVRQAGESEVTASLGHRVAGSGSNDPEDYPVGDAQLETQAERANPDGMSKLLGLNGQERDENPDDYRTGEL